MGKTSTRRRGGGGGTSRGAQTSATIGQLTSGIANKDRRRAVYTKLRKERKADKAKLRRKRQEEHERALEEYEKQLAAREKREMTRAGEHDTKDAVSDESDGTHDAHEETSGEEEEEEDDDDDDSEGGGHGRGADGEGPIDVPSDVPSKPVKRQPITIESERIRDDEASAVVDAQEMLADPVVQRITGGGGMREPNVIITTTRKPSAGLFALVAELLTLFPRATFFKRRDYEIKKIIEYGTARSFTAVIVLNEDRKVVNGLLHINLPVGPTAYYKLTNLKMPKEIHNHGRPTDHRPEIILNKFSTRMGHRVAHMFASLFSPDPEFRGRRVVTFHNQRDFIFVRHHRYIFDEKQRSKVAGGKPRRVISRLQELGPRFTLRLLSLQNALFGSKEEGFVWRRDVDGKAADKVRRKFAL